MSAKLPPAVEHLIMCEISVLKRELPYYSADSLSILEQAVKVMRPIHRHPERIPILLKRIAQLKVGTKRREIHGKLRRRIQEFERKCVHCGCTESNACPGGCSWAIKHKATPTGVCSQCVPQEVKLSDAL